MSPVLEVSSVSLVIDGRKILDDVSFSVEKGSFTVLAGKNGAGKSQLLKIIKGLKKPSSGTIAIKGEDVTKSRQKRLSSVGLVFQNSDLQFVGETVEKDIMFGPDATYVLLEDTISPNTYTSGGYIHWSTYTWTISAGYGSDWGYQNMDPSDF